MYSRHVRALLVAAAALALTTPVRPLAAQQTGTIRGRVTDAASQRPVGDVQVTIVGSGLGALTGPSGDYTIVDLSGRFFFDGARRHRINVRMENLLDDDAPGRDVGPPIEQAAVVQGDRPNVHVREVDPASGLPVESDDLGPVLVSDRVCVAEHAYPP